MKWFLNVVMMVVALGVVPVSAQAQLRRSLQEQAVQAFQNKGKVDDAKREKVTADTFDKAVKQTSPRFKGAFTVGLIFINFPDCQPVDVEACLERQRTGVEAYFRKYTQDQCWPEFTVLGVYDAPNPLGYYVRYDQWCNRLGSTNAQETENRVEALFDAAQKSVARGGSRKSSSNQGKSAKAAKPDVTAYAYATTCLPVKSEKASEKSLERISALRKCYPVIRASARAAAGDWSGEDVDELVEYAPAQAIAWGDPLHPNSRIVVRAEGDSGTMIHELGHVLGAPDTYHVGQPIGGIPGNPVCVSGGPTAPLYARYRYCGLLGPEAYPIIRQSKTVQLAPRWSRFDGSRPLGVFIPTVHPNYLLHLEYEPSQQASFSASEEEAGAIPPAGSTGGGISIYVINVTMETSYFGTPDMVYSYRHGDPWFRGARMRTEGQAQPSAYGPAVFRTGDAFDAKSDPANLLPNQLPTGVTLTFGPQTAEGASVTIGVPTQRLSGNALAQSLLPVVKTEPITEALPTSLRATLTVQFRGEPAFYEFGFCYGPRPNPTLRDQTVQLWGFTDWRDTTRILGLRPGATVYVRAYAKSALGVTYAAESQRVTLPQRVSEVPPLLLDSYCVGYSNGRYDKEGTLLNDTGATALLKMMAFLRRPLAGKQTSRNPFSYQRLHLHPGYVLPPKMGNRFGPTITDLSAAYTAAQDLAAAAGLADARFGDDFAKRVTKALNLSTKKVRWSSADQAAAKKAGLTSAEMNELAGAVVPFSAETFPVLWPRIRASLVNAMPVLFVRASTFESSRRCALDTCIIDGWRPNPDNPSGPSQLHFSFSTHNDRHPRFQRPSGWYDLEPLFDRMDDGRLIFLN